MLEATHALLPQASGAYRDISIPATLLCTDRNSQDAAARSSLFETTGHRDSVDHASLHIFLVVVPPPQALWFFRQNVRVILLVRVSAGAITSLHPISGVTRVRV
jgi:hypothetical protein